MSVEIQDQGWDEQNVSLAQSNADVDATNAMFYGKYPFPPRAQRLERSLDPDFHRTFICQDFGDWQTRTIPADSAIWVAGCGTNQALLTALAFPHSSVIGSDVSVPSLEIAARGKSDLSLANLELRCESLNDCSYKEQFDYILCTGVIHHNADPAVALEHIASALKPRGILELMVYNRYQRIPSSQVQKALSLLADGRYGSAAEVKLRLAEDLVSHFEVPGRMGTFLRGLRDARQSELADSAMQPVEYSYTVASLNKLADSCGLEMVAPVMSIHDKLKGIATWDLKLPTPRLRQAYESLDDVSRWQVMNLLLGENSPLLWFYFRRASTMVRLNEHQICDSFLATKFKRSMTRKQAYQLGEDAVYRLIPGSFAYPPPLQDRLRAVVDAADGAQTMGAILGQLGIAREFPEVNAIRARLTTTAFPYLKAVAR